MKRKLLFMAALGCAALGLAACEGESGGGGGEPAEPNAFIYSTKTENGETKISIEGLNSYGKGKTELVVPLEIDGYPVAYVEARTFAENDTLEKVSFPSSLENIEEEAFLDCWNLKEVAFAADCPITTISQVFLRCRVENVILPSGVTEIQENAFEGALLGSIDIPDSVTTIGSYAFSGCGLKSLSLPDSLTEIASGAFSSNSFTSIEIPAQVTKISSYAFNQCVDLQTVSVQDGSVLQTIESYSFEGCNALQTIEIPQTVTQIGSHAFLFCKSVTNFDVAEENVTYRSIDGSLYSEDGTTLLRYAMGKTDTTFTIPSTVTEFDWGAFSYSLHLTSIEIPASVTDLGIDTFAGCTNLQTVTFAEGIQITEIPSGMFERCTALKELVIPEGVTSIGYQDNDTFTNCTALEKITLPSTLTKIYSSRFEDCTSLSTIIFNGTTGYWWLNAYGSWEKNPAVNVECSDGLQRLKKN